MPPAPAHPEASPHPCPPSNCHSWKRQAWLPRRACKSLLNGKPLINGVTSWERMGLGPLRGCLSNALPQHPNPHPQFSLTALLFSRSPQPSAVLQKSHAVWDAGFCQHLQFIACILPSQFCSKAYSVFQLVQRSAIFFRVKEDASIPRGQEDIASTVLWTLPAREVECVSHSKLECKLWRAWLLSAALGTGLWFMPRNVPELVGPLMYLLNE